MPQPERWLLLRFARDGRSKDWAICAIGDQLFVRFGKTGGPMQQRELVRASWRSPAAATEGKRRIQEQIEQGYVIHGQCSFGPDGRVAGEIAGLEGQMPVNFERTDPGPRRDSELFYEISASDPGAFTTLLKHVVALFGDAVPIRWLSQKDVPSGVPVIVDWIPQLKADPGATTIKGNGGVRREDTFSPVLFLLAVRQHAPTSVAVTLAHKDGDLIGPNLRKELGLLKAFGISLDEVEKLAEDIGVIEKFVKLSEVKTDVNNFWF